jgi:hypothetical protein
VVVVAALVLLAALQLRNNLSTLGSPDRATVASQPPPAVAVTVGLAPAVPAVEPAGECLTYATTYDRAPETVAGLASVATRVVAATVEEVGPARWKTADEKPPSERQNLTGDADMRLVRFSIKQDLGGGGANGAVVGWIPGGVIGCHKFMVGGYPLDITPGQQFTLFLDDRQAPTRALGGVSQVMEMWPIVGNTVKAPGGDLTLLTISIDAAQALSLKP